jgi:hypothetical protein
LHDTAIDISLPPTLTRREGDVIELWSARDSLVLKALTIVLADAFEVSDRYTHIKGNGAQKGQ